MMEKTNTSSGRFPAVRWDVLFLLALGGFMAAWAFTQRYNYSPDEQMRYVIVEYMVEHNRLPHGGDPAIRDKVWGISYAFYPMLSLMVSYVFMKIASFFTSSFEVLVCAARLAEVMFGVIHAWFVLKIADKLFPKKWARLFAALVLLLPGAFVLFSYLNCDSLALMATSMLIWCWLRGLEDGWSVRTCLLTGVGVSICALSYYNAYGVVLATIVVFALSILLGEEKKWNFRKLFSRGLIITAVFAVLALWWFVRSYILYDGDFLGLNITTVYEEKYAMEAIKPSVRVTFAEDPNMSLKDMLLIVPANLKHNWIFSVYYSFIGCFGYMNDWTPEWVGKALFVVFLAGLIGVLVKWRELFALLKQTFTRVFNVAGREMKAKFSYRLDRMRPEGIFHVGLLITMILPNLLSLYNSYFQDYQGQGRYSMPMLVPLMYFTVYGVRALYRKASPQEKGAAVFTWTLCAAMAAFVVWCYFGIIIPKGAW